MASQAPTSGGAPEHLQNDANQSLKGSDYPQQHESGPKLQNGGQIIPPSTGADQHAKNIKSPPSNGNTGVGPPNEMSAGPGYHHDPNLGPPPQSAQPGHHMHHSGPGDKDELSQQPPHHHQHPMYGHQPMHGHPMHGPPPPQQHIPGHHLPMHPHQQRYHPHQAGPHGPPHGMQHPMHSHDPNQQQQMDPYGHYRGMMPTRPPQRYGLPPQGPQGPVPPQNTQNVPTGAQQPPPGAQQGPTPTLNSLLQSQPSPQQGPAQQGAQHRYPNPGPYDPYGPPVSGNGPPPIPPNSGPSSPMPALSQSQQQQQQQQNWAPPPRPYSPQQYRGPPPVSQTLFYEIKFVIVCLNATGFENEWLVCRLFEWLRHNGKNGEKISVHSSTNFLRQNSRMIKQLSVYLLLLP